MGMVYLSQMALEPTSQGNGSGRSGSQTGPGPQSQWPTPEPQNTFRFKNHVNRKRPIPGIMTPADHGHILKQKYHTDVDLVVNCHCNYYIRNGVSVDTTQSMGHFMVLNTNNATVRNIHALHALNMGLSGVS